MTSEPILCARCPKCGADPVLIVGVQGFCDADGCDVLSWDMRDDPATLLERVQVVELFESTSFRWSPDE